MVWWHLTDRQTGEEDDGGIEGEGDLIVLGRREKRNTKDALVAVFFSVIAHFFGGLCCYAIPDLHCIVSLPSAMYSRDVKVSNTV
jgi:hypothetical protein